MHPYCSHRSGVSDGAVLPCFAGVDCVAEGQLGKPGAEQNPSGRFLQIWYKSLIIQNGEDSDNGSDKFPSDASVGPYWFVRDETGKNLLLAHRCALLKAEPYGRFLTCPHGHCELWDRWRAECRDARLTAIARAFEYEEWPRGRVVFDSELRRFLVYADAQIFRRDLQERILKRFGIPPHDALFLRDEHYVSTERLAPE
jgi:hypothetical protein